MEIQEKILTNSLRNNLKKIIENELKELPKQLEALEPKERLNFICKIMPYVFPKVEAVDLKQGEPFSFD